MKDNKFKNILIYMLTVSSIIILSILLTSSYRSDIDPDAYYEVYLDGDVIGAVKSKKELENYIDKNNYYYKKKFDVKNVYSPNGLVIEKKLTYDKKISSVEDIYNIIQARRPFTIRGYQFTINTTIQNGKKEEKRQTKIYVTDNALFDEAVVNLFKAYVGTDEYQAYVDETQVPITTTGTIIDNVYLKDNITIKKTNIPVTETIYSDANELSQFLLFGKENKKTNYTVKTGDTIETVAFNNKISVEEFLMSNPTFTSSKSLLFPGQQVVIGMTDPQVEVVVEQSVVKDVVNKYKTVEKYDSSRYVGDDRVTQKGEDGLERVSQKVEIINGNITYIKPISKTELKPATDKIIVRGKKQYASGYNGGGVAPATNTSWGWPTNSGYTISSDYGWRVDPWSRRRNLHYGIDISGTGHGSPVYSVADGTVMSFGCHWSYGLCLLINHNNGYYTLYAHMSAKLVSPGQNVAKGQQIGRVGMTGSATGPHLHFEVYTGGMPYRGGVRQSPWILYR